MIDLLAQLLPLGVGGAFSPVPTTICIMLLSNRKPLARAPAYVLGFGTVLVAIGILALTGFGRGFGPDERSFTIGHTIDATAGVLFLVFALKTWLNAPDPNAPPPKWMAAIESSTMGEAFLVGVITMVTNVTTLVLYVSGLKEIVTANVDIVGSFIALALFILLVMVELLVPIAIYAVAPVHASSILSSAKRWLEKNNRVVTIILLVAYGIFLLAKSIPSLLG